VRSRSAEGRDAESLRDQVELPHSIPRRCTEIDAGLALEDFSGHRYPFDQRAPDHGQRGGSDSVVARAAGRRYGTPWSHRLSSLRPEDRLQLELVAGSVR